MDWEKLRTISSLVKELIGDSEPSDEDLDFNDDYIELYSELHNLKEVLEHIGL